MNHSGDAAEQIVRMSLEGVEVAAKITGAAAKETALFILAALKSPEKQGGKLKLKGKERLESMLKSGKALDIFSVKESDLQTFMQAAKQYGIVYCVVRNAKGSPDGLCDVMVRAEDAPKINRVVERFQFATVDKAKIESEIVASKMNQRDAGPNIAQVAKSDISDTDKLLDDLLSVPEARAVAQGPFVGSGPERGNPPPKTNPSAPTFESRRSFGRDASTKPSVRGELHEIVAANRVKSSPDTPRRQASSIQKFKNPKERT